MIKFSIYLCSKFLSFRINFFVCLINPDYRLVWMTSHPQLLRISGGLLY
jgi:hypothetical protein